MDLGFEKFLGALHALQNSSMEGNDEAIKKFQYAINNIMPAPLSTGKYKSLGALLKQLSNEFMPFNMTSYYAKDADQRRLTEGVKDILETVGYVIKQLAEDKEDAGEVVRDTLMNLNQRLKKMEKLKTKFVYIGVRDGMRELFEQTTVLPGKIDEYLGKGDFSKEIKETFTDRTDPIVYSKTEGLLPTIYRANPYGAPDLEAHQEFFTSVDILKLYLKLGKVTLQHALNASSYDLKGATSDLKMLLCDGMIHEDYWEKFKVKIPENYEIDKQFSELVNTFSKEVVNPDENLSDELISISLFNVGDWMQWALAMFKNIPLLTATRKNLMFYRNITFEILKEINEKRDAIFKSVKGHDKEGSAVKLLKAWENALIKVGKSDAKPKLKAFFKSLDLQTDEPVEDMIDTIHMTHQMLWVIDREVKTLITVSNDFFENDGANVVENDLGNPVFQFENLVNRCALSVQQNQVTPMRYTPLFNSISKRLTVNGVDLIIKKLQRIFPECYFPLETFSFKKPLSFKAKDVMNDFTAKNFSGVIGKMRDEYKSFKDPTGKLKILIIPGMGSGCFDESSNTLIVPLFHEKKDFEVINFYGAFADYIYTTRRPALTDEMFLEMWNILQERKKIPPQIMVNNQRYILMLAFMDLVKCSEGTKTYEKYYKILSEAMNVDPESFSGELNAELEGLVGEYKRSSF